jgi:hypothetical protein
MGCRRCAVHDCPVQQGAAHLLRSEDAKALTE